ncbi:MAG TPA: NAD(P)H-dependent glycerol-3-phosphate dehydrogenase [Candidatus Cloacimonadota bacterium]|nr:NAD(P)H-dependent glycerol-3-phosphate dehydrogenase [Candidatus Cloacimonadota bacterium]HQH50518.1 NAD(P)H-dependent glycerol-3-phosphate dehydrogenase [Candidatus Cloacimonadota bacterium]
MRVSVIGGGGWGLALARLLHRNGHSLQVWEHNATYLATLISNHANPALLPGITLPEDIVFTGDFASVEKFSPHIVILATPSQYLRPTLRSMPPETQKGIWMSPGLLAVVNVAKGIEEGSLQTLDAVLGELLPEAMQHKICALSGPSHAEEVAREVPTAVVVAGKNEDLLITLQEVFSNDFFRVYRSNDLLGVEIGGAVKNIIAIAAGIIDGLGFGDNTIGALLTRGIVEIQRFGVALGAKAETFWGLSGLGDLVTTATSPHSRNRYVGKRIGEGKKLRQITQEMEMVAEGVATTNSVYQLALQRGIEMPIVREVWEILYQEKDPRQAIVSLMTRELKAE